LKAGNKSWKEIASELGRTQAVLKTRFKELKASVETGKSSPEFGAVDV
jgi:hypothetical protein